MGIRRTVVFEFWAHRQLWSSGIIRCASTFPSSTPHWSNGLMFQMTALSKHIVLGERH